MWIAFDIHLLADNFKDYTDLGRHSFFSEFWNEGIPVVVSYHPAVGLQEEIPITLYTLLILTWYILF